MNSLQKVLTEGIWLGGRRESFDASNVAIDVADPKIDLLEPVVSVRVEIGERRSEKEFSGVPVSTLQGGKVQPATTTITWSGATSLLDSLKAEDLKLVIDSTSETLQPRLQLPDSLTGKVFLKSVHTSKFVPVK